MPQITVLLVEDSAVDALLAKAHLRSAGQFAVSHVETLAAAAAALRNGGGADVVVLDLNLPDSAGLETFRKLHDQFPATPLVILSGEDDERLAVEAVALGAQDYVLKSAVDAPLLARSLRYAIERGRRQVLEHDLAVARDIQKHLLPKRPPTIDGFDIAGVCQPAEECSGDFFDFIELDDGKCDFVIADVSSHGFGPALMMIGARRVLRSCAATYNDLGKLLTVANGAVCEDSLDAQFVTLFYARLDAAARALSYSAAGHPAWIISPGGDARQLEYHGALLGLAPDATYATDGSVALQTGDMFLLMTDGAWEAHAPDGELFGRQRVFDVIHAHRARLAADILALVVDAIRRFCHPRVPADDVTIVLAKVVG